MFRRQCSYTASVVAPARHALRCSRHEYRHHLRASVGRYSSQTTTDLVTVRHYSYPTPDRALGSTIYALSTAAGKAAIAVIRISGPEAAAVYDGLCPAKPLLKPRYAVVRTLYQPGCPASTETMLDSSAMVLYLPGPRSATGEDILELHVHGGPATVKAILSAIPQCAPKPGTIRYAEAGEFTRRAFFNDRIDLTQVEALGEILSAATEQQRRLGVRGTVSKLARRYDSWREMLLAARGELEALIDFSEDQHFDESPAELIANVSRQVVALQASLSAHTKNAMRGELLRNGISISLLGAPNAGKSSLLNRIVGREAAIVSHEAGTTRDVVEISVDIGGYLCRFGDTAGLRRALATHSAESNEKIGIVEQEGIRRAKERALDSDLVILVLSVEPTQDGQHAVKLDQEVLDTARDLLSRGTDLVVAINKIDRMDTSSSLENIRQQVQLALSSIPSTDIHPVSCLPISTKTLIDDDGIPSFLAGLTRTFTAMTSAVTPGDADVSIWQESLSATARQRVALEECAAHLDAFLAVAGPSSAVDMIDEKGHEGEVDFVLAAEHLRAAAGCLGRITGKGEAGDVEEVLGVVFEKFCVGK